MKVFIVRQWQPEECYMGLPCGVYDTYDEAVRVVKQLNKEYSFGIEWYENEEYIKGDILEDDWAGNYHYYDIATFELNNTDCIN